MDIIGSSKREAFEDHRLREAAEKNEELHHIKCATRYVLFFKSRFPSPKSTNFVYSEK